MFAVVYVAPHERSEIIAAYRDRLLASQIEEIDCADESAWIKLSMGPSGKVALVTVETPMEKQRD